VVWRVDTVKLLPALEQVDLLLRLAKATRTLVNMEHKRRRLLYKQSGIIDCSVKGAYWDPSYAAAQGAHRFEELRLKRSALSRRAGRVSRSC
jgi:hypothetical protein